eukprot:gene5738-7922_t
MVKIIEKIRNNSSAYPYFSFEFFPPKTEAGVDNLYLRMDRMTALQPLFVDITWGAGGCTKDLTMAICEYTQTYFGVDVMMHLTCTDLTKEELKHILNTARSLGIRNILALRGDPAKGSISWAPVPGGCHNAIDLVKLIREEHGDYFGIAVGAFPEGHPQSNLRGDDSMDLIYLKEKIEAGADFVLTQFFYDTTVFLNFIKKCEAIGINCPIIPGMMPIQSFSSFQKMTSFCRTKVPQEIWDDLMPIKDNDEAVKAYGVQLCEKICKTLSENGIKGFHFYTLNLEQSVMNILKELGIENSIALRRTLPWRGSRSTFNGHTEDVRPINWANRPKSYIKRTVAWDDFPNGRWGDNRSPAFGELSDSHFYRPVEGTRQDRLAMWGEAPLLPEDIYEVFASYIEGRIPILPWCETALQLETIKISSPLSNINRVGFLTINSQPAVNGEKSDHSVYGWGGAGGRVYQKAYVEFFTSPIMMKAIMEVVGLCPELSFYAVNSEGLEYTSNNKKSVTALTWGVFPNQEILQPTIFDPDTFLVWSKEAFELWTKAWASLYDDASESSSLLYEIHDTYYLVAIIDNNYFENNLFDVFEIILNKYQSMKNSLKSDDISTQQEDNDTIY